MWYLIASLLWPLLAAMLLGLMVGWNTCGRDAPKLWSGWVPAGVIIFFAALLVAIAQWLKGRSGLALDTALLFFGSYIAGCCLGCLFRQWLAPDAALAIPAAATMPVAAAAIPRAAPAAPPAPLPAVAPAPLVAPPPAPPAPAPAPIVTAELAPAPAVEGEHLHAGARPMGLASPRGGKADDLKLVRGIGKQNEARLHGLGVWHFDQIAGWTRENVDWVGSYLAFPGRIDREDWVNQARQLAAGETTDFAARVKRGEVATSKDDGSAGQANVAALGADGFDGVRPRNTLKSAREGKQDDLKLINGVGRALEQKLNQFGIWHFDQIAAMSDDELRYLSHWLGFPGRALREKWREDSATLASGGETDHSRAVKAGKIPSSSNQN